MTPGEEFLTEFQRGSFVDKLRQLDPATLHKAIPWGKFSILEIFTETEANEKHNTILSPALLQKAARTVKSYSPPYEEFWAEFLAEMSTADVMSYVIRAMDHVTYRILDLARRQEYLQIFRHQLEVCAIIQQPPTHSEEELSA